MTPVKVWAESNPSILQLTEFMSALRTYGVETNTIEIFEFLVTQPPPKRLLINLQAILLLSQKAQITNVLEDGLAEGERNALMELDYKGLPVEARQIAHGLFNVHERWKMLKTLSKALREAADSRTQYIR